jgi:hypothetical protein
MGISMRGDGPSVGQRYDQAYPASAVGSILQVKVVVIAVELLQSRARIAKPKSVTLFRWVVAHSHAIVRDFDLDRTVVSCGTYVDITRSSGFRNAVPNGILDEGLQDQAGDGRGKQIGIDIEMDGQPVLEASLLNVKVVLQKVLIPASAESLATPRSPETLSAKPPV